jgi:hypothetical protein
MAAPVNQESPNTLLSDSTLKVLDLLCEGPISGFAQKNPSLPMDPLMSIYFDDVPIRNVDGSYNYNVSGAGFFYDYMLGSASQSGISGFQKVEVAIPLQSNTLISNPPIGAGPYKTVVTTISTDTYPDADSIRMTVRVPALYTQDNNGNTNGFELSYAVDISLNNGAYVAQSPTDGPSANAVSVINGKCTTAYLQTVTYVLPKTTPPSSRYSWRIRVRRVSEDIQSTRTQNAIFVDSISVVSANGYAYPNSAMSAISIASNQFSSIPNRSYDIMGMLLSVPNGYTPTKYNYGYNTFAIGGNLIAGNKQVGVEPNNLAYFTTGVEYGMKVTGVGIPANTYITSVNRAVIEPSFTISEDATATASPVPLTVFSTDITPTIIPASYPTIWTGDFRTGVWTDNPAWVFYDMVTDPVHGLGDYISAASIDKWTLYQIAQYCDEMVDDGDGGLEPRFTCNVAIQQPDQAYSVLLNLASTFRGMMYYANGTIQLSQSADTKYPVYDFTNANVVNGSFSYSDTAKNTRSTVAMVKWRDPNNGFREAIQYIEDVEGIQRYGYVQKDITAFACSSPGQAYRLGTWALQTERLLTETVTFQTSLEGLYLRPGDNFAVYDNFRNNRSQGGRIAGFSTGRSFVDLDRPVTLEAGVTYTLTAITPKAVADPMTVTGSNQISSIRQTQIETYRVIDTPGTYTRLGMAGQFDSGIYIGSPWTLSASGYTGIFNTASFYTCLATSEIEPGKIEVLGLQASTGVNFLISTGYTIVDDPPNNGDSTSIRPPSALNIAYQTGALADNTFYQNLYVTWTDTPDKGRNFSQYVVSGRAYATSSTDQYVTPSNFTTWAAEVGTYEFNVAAVSLGGEISSYINASYTVPATNPFGRTPPLSGVFITENFDDYLFSSNGAYTGFVGQNPTLGWNFQKNSDGFSSPAYDLVTGYRIRVSGFDGTSNYLSPTVIISGRDNSSYAFPAGFLYTGLGGPARRGFDLYVDTMDAYGNIATGGRLKMNNPPPKPPQASGFVGFNGGFQYSFTPQVTDVDISGVYLWYNNSPSFVPQFGNQNYATPNLTDIVINNVYQINDYYMWFSLVDTFGYTGCNIYGPTRINPNGSFSGAYFNINQQLTLLAGGYSGLSGYTTGQIYQMNTIVATASGILSQQINSVSASVTSLSGYTNGQIVDVRQVIANTGQANVNYSIGLTAAVSGYTNAQINTTNQLIASTSGASAVYTNNLLAGTTGVNASVQIMANAYVTGQTNGIGGVAVASWGFNLDANGKAAGLRATTNNATQYGVLALSGLSIQSESFSPGVKGWRIDPSGNAEFGNAVVRGSFTGGAGTNAVSMNSEGVTIGAGGDAKIIIRAVPIFGNDRLISFTNVSSVPVASIGQQSNFGYFSLTNAAGSETISMGGNDGSVNCDYLNVGATSDFDGIATFNEDIYLGNTSQARYLYFRNGGHIEWGLGGSMDTNLYRDGASSLKTDDAFTAASVNTTSSARFKDNISPLDGSMDMVRQLSGVRFDWNNKDLDNDIGLIAENVYSIAPTLVGKNSSGQIESVDYGRIAAILVEATKEIDARLKKVEEINGF